MKVVVVEYNAEWPQEFELEAARIANILNQELVEIHHIGSTSVPGLQAKSVIDMLPVVRDITRIDAYNEAMIALGYEPMGENGLPGRRFYRRGGGAGERTHHAHVYQHEHEDVARHVAFRDYLRAHSEIAKEYGELKAGLALLHPDSIEDYMDGKDGFIKEHEQKALLWQRGKLRP